MQPTQHEMGPREIFAAMCADPLFIDDRGLRLALEEAQHAPSAGYWRYHDREDPLYESDGSVAVIRILGPLRKEGRYYYGTSYATVRAAIEQAQGDSDIRGIFLDIDSGGGTVNGCFELVDWMRSDAVSKPVWAMANDWACSGAYAIASAASRLWVSGTGCVGSVGVIRTHVDYTAMDQRIGLKITAIRGGERKARFNDFEALDDEERATQQAWIDELWASFIGRVAANRGLSQAAVRSSQAEVYNGRNAVPVGFADQVGTREECLAAFREELRTGRAGLTVSNPAPPEEEDDMSDTNAGTPAPTPDAESPQPANPTANTPDAPAAGAEPAAPVVDLDSARSEASAAALAQDRERQDGINQACELAGCPELAGGMIAEGLSVQQAGARILEQRAASAGTEIRPGAPDAGEAPRTIDARAIYQGRASVMDPARHTIQKGA